MSTHLDNFSKYNKIGDSVEVEFNINTFNWKPDADDKIFTSLSCWKVDKADAPVDNTPPVNAAQEDDLPF